MKDYIFVLGDPLESEEIIIEASGMMDAFKKAKDVQKKKSIEEISKVNLIFKGIIY